MLVGRDVETEVGQGGRLLPLAQMDSPAPAGQAEFRRPEILVGRDDAEGLGVAEDIDGETVLVLDRKVTGFNHPHQRSQFLAALEQLGCVLSFDFQVFTTDIHALPEGGVDGVGRRLETEDARSFPHAVIDFVALRPEGDVSPGEVGGQFIRLIVDGKIPYLEMGTDIAFPDAGHAQLGQENHPFDGSVDCSGTVDATFPGKGAGQGVHAGMEVADDEEGRILSRQVGNRSGDVQPGSGDIHQETAEIDIEPEFLICGGFGIQGDPTLPTEAVIVEGRSGNGEAGMAGRQGAFRQVAVAAGIERKYGVRPEFLEYGEIILVCPDQFIERTVPDGGICTEISLLRVEDTLSGGPEVQGS